MGSSKYFFIFFLMVESSWSKPHRPRQYSYGSSDDQDADLQLERLGNTLTHLIPTNRRDAGDQNAYAEAMDEFKERMDDLTPELEDEIERLIEEADYEDLETLRNAKEVVRAIEISGKELKAVTKQQKNKRKMFLRAIADDAKESVLATVEGVRNLVETLEDVDPKMKRDLDESVYKFQVAASRLAEDMERCKKKKRRLKLHK